MKFKGQGKINICGLEYKKNIADSRRGGGGPSTPKKPVSAPREFGQQSKSQVEQIGHAKIT